jgi:hypothetical protein
MCRYLLGMPFREKFLRTPGVLELAGRHVKRYHVTSTDDEIPDTIQRAALAFLPRLLPEPDGEMPPASFSILHTSPGASYLCAYSWVWGNVIEARTAAAGVPFLGCEDENPASFRQLDRPWIGCVWELGPFGHERSAWVRHMLTPDQPDLPGYLADTLAGGTVGGPR